MNESPRIQDGDAIRGRKPPIQIVGGENGRRPLLAELIEERGQTIGRHRIEPGVGLVEQQQRRSMQDRACDGEPLMHSPRKAPHRRVGSCQKIGATHCLFDHRIDVGETVQARVESEVLSHREIRIEKTGVRDEADAASNLFVGGGVLGSAVDQPTLGGFHQGRGKVEKSCFSGAIPAEEGQHLAGGDAQVEPEYGGEATEALGDPSSLERGAQCWLSRARRACSSRFSFL